jgi:tRNA 2-thiouridine synthesizing protein E
MNKAPYLTDKEGFLEDPETWGPEFAKLTAANETIDLTGDHWELIEQTRLFYEEYGFSPSMRPLVKFIGINLGPEKGKSIYLMKLFSPSPARMLAKLAGLHKPKNCL